MRFRGFGNDAVDGERHDVLEGKIFVVVDAECSVDFAHGYAEGAVDAYCVGEWNAVCRIGCSSGCFRLMGGNLGVVVAILLLCESHPGERFGV